MAKRKLAVSLMIVGVLLVAGAGSLFLYNSWDENRASDAALQTAQVLTSLIKEQAEAVAPTNAPDETPPEVDDGSTDAEAQEEARPPSIVYDGNHYVGVLKVSALDLSLPIMEFWSYDKLKVSPCRFSGNPADDNLVVMAHNYNKHFGGISLLLYGELVTFTDAEGVEYIYEVAEIETVNSHDISGMVNNDYDFTMFTCTYSGQARIAVRCIAVGK